MNTNIRGKAIVVVAGLVLAGTAAAQQRTTPAFGLHENTPRVHAFTGARVIVAPGVMLEGGTVVVRDGIIEAVGESPAIPADARVWALEGRTIYAGFIDPMTEVGLPDAMASPSSGRGGGGGASAAPGPASGDGARYWNAHVRPENDVAAELVLGNDTTEDLRELGFTTALSVPRRGVLRGQSALLSLGESTEPRQIIVSPRVALHAGYQTGGARGDGSSVESDYPSSLMGVIALLRQALYDAQWYGAAEAYYADEPTMERPALNLSLEAMLPVINAEQPLFYHADDELDYQRALNIGDEFNLDVVLVGNGYEYRMRELFAASGVGIIIPLDFPDAPQVDTPDRALGVSLEQLQHWELAPSNAAFLEEAGVSFAFTSDGLGSPGNEFWANVRSAVERGLHEDTALAALTTVPAELVGAGEKLGTIETGKIANLVVADGNLFAADSEAEVELMVVDGMPYELEAFDRFDPEGLWRATWPGGSGDWELSGDPGRLTLTVNDEEYQGRAEGDELILLPSAEVFGGDDALARLSAYHYAGTVEGIAELPSGDTFIWSAVRIGDLPEQPEGGPDADADEVADNEENAEDGLDGSDSAGVEDEPDEPDIPPLVWNQFPAGAYGATEPPPQADSLLIRGATIWTSGPQGRIDDGDLLIRGDRIEAVGRDLEAPRDAIVMDAAGKHVTAGLIDSHSHSAVSRSVNESGSVVTLEVRIADVLNPTDIAIYRELAGGLTAALLLHGSANPMGGQAQVVKLRWGENADGLRLDGAPPGVKFALGENVKQSNWGDAYTDRYPQSRMGVEQIIRDTFLAAARYGREMDQASRRGPPVRRNLRLDAALEILDGERLIHVHSYRQDEILAFVRIAQDFELEVAAFQHVLEGYKVADAIAELGAGGSTFSDWWAYKFEVYDAIPYNGALMHRAGVVTSFNSDSNELARRLNTEASKAVKYGGVSEEEALAFVTINPARQLRIDDRVGSLEPDKDADFVIWSGHPLSSFSRAEQTWIEGRKYFDVELDAEMRRQTAVERSRLIQKALATRLNGGNGSGGDGEGSGRGGDGSGRGGRGDPPTDLYSACIELYGCIEEAHP